MIIQFKLPEDDMKKINTCWSLSGLHVNVTF